jgi:hypothetical protein
MLLRDESIPQMCEPIHSEHIACFRTKDSVCWPRLQDGGRRATSGAHISRFLTMVRQHFRYG